MPHAQGQDFAEKRSDLWGERLFREADNSRIKPVLRKPFAVTNVGREPASELRAPASTCSIPGMSHASEPMPGRTAAPPAPGHGYASRILFGITALALIFRFCRVVLKYAVNLFYYDEWDTYSSLFAPQPWWRIFVGEHAPHRQGLGVVVATKLLSFAHWDSRVQAFIVGAAIVIAMILATYLKIRAFGSISAWDIAIPVIFLGLGQWETMLGAAGASPQAFPLLLIVAYCFAWMESRRPFTYVLVLIINFVLIFTGYGICMAGITLLLFGLEAYHGARAHDRGRTKSAVLSLAIATASLASFFYGYQFSPAVACYQFPYHDPAAYPVFWGLMFANFLAVKQGVILASILGMGVIVVVSSLMMLHIRALWKGPSADRASMLIVILLGFSLTFSAATAVGRVCLGPEGARASRYLPLLIPAFLGIYFSILAIRNHRKRALRAGIFILLLLPSCVHQNRKEIEAFSALKQNWKQCYLAHEDIRFCDAEANFQLYPCPECIQMKEKLEFLKRNRLNLYSDRK